MESEYISVCTVLGLKCGQRLKKYWRPLDENQEPMDGSNKKRDIRLAKDEFVDYSGRVQRYLLN